VARSHGRTGGSCPPLMCSLSPSSRNLTTCYLFTICSCPKLVLPPNFRALSKKFVADSAGYVSQYQCTQCTGISAIMRYNNIKLMLFSYRLQHDKVIATSLSLLGEDEFLVVTFRNAVMPITFVSKNDSPLYFHSVNQVYLSADYSK